MPITSGGMQIGRINVAETTTNLTMFPSDHAVCGDTITFVLSVSTLSGPARGGYLSLVRVSDGYVYGTKHNTEGVVNIDGTYIYDGYHILQAKYTGFADGYKPSISTPQSYYVSKINTTTTINADTSHTFNHASTYTVYVNSNSDIVVDGGTIRIRLYSDNATFWESSDFPMVGGNATCIIPSGTAIAGKSYYLTAIYSGYLCLDPSYSPIGILGYPTTAT